MRRRYQKKSFPVEKIRRFIEPGPIVLVSSAWEGRRDIMTMGWHTMMEFSPALVGCIISEANHSFGLITGSHECVINLPTIDIMDEVIGIGNTSGADLDKFDHFNLTAGKATKVKAPLIEECYANFECRLADDSLIEKYNFFIWEVVNARAALSPKHPATMHYTGEGVFMIAGKTVSRRRKFRSDIL